MSFQVAFAWSKESEEEMVKMGFTKREVYMKDAPPPGPLEPGEGHTAKQRTLGDKEFFAMNRPPYQFATTSYWGAGNG
jgi:hypothetical protein